MPQPEEKPSNSQEQGQNSQENSQNSNGQQPTNSPQNPLEIQPPISVPDSRIDVLAATVNKLAEQNSLIIQQLQQQNAQQVNRSTVVEQRPELPTNDDVWKDPVKAIGQIVAAQNAPINEAAQLLIRDTKYRQLKAQIVSSPQWLVAVSKFPGFESTFDSQATQIPADKLDINALSFVMNSVVGYFALNTPAAPAQVPTNPAPTNNGQPANMSGLPAHLRPTNPAPKPTNNGGTQEPELTENERVLATRWGMTPTEFKAQMAGGALQLDPTKGRA